MRHYEDAPKEGEICPNPEEVKKVIITELVEELPESDVNEWFLESVHFANMVDSIVREIWKTMGVEL